MNRILDVDDWLAGAEEVDSRTVVDVEEGEAAGGGGGALDSTGGGGAGAFEAIGGDSILEARVVSLGRV